MPQPSESDWAEKVFSARDKDELARHYNSWAATYDSDLVSWGYVNPQVIAGLTARYITDRNAAILDAGVGTGALGQILALLGYDSLLGIDLSEGMLAQARARNIYRDLRKRMLGEPLDFDDGTIDAVVSAGTFTTGHAPASAWDELARITRPGGYLISTFGTVVWDEAGFAEKLSELAARGLVEAVEVTPIYHPMPLSLTESHFTTRAHVYRKL